MKILPITNQQNKNSFKSANTARFMLSHYEMTTKANFQSGNLYHELAKLDYSDSVNRKGLYNLFRHATNVLRMSDSDLRTGLAIFAGIRNNNVNYLRVLMEERELIPVQPDGSISTAVIIAGQQHPNPQIRRFFDEDYLLKRAENRELLRMEEAPKPYELYEGRDLFDDIFDLTVLTKRNQPVRDSYKDKMLNDVKKRIEMDEEQFGQVQIETLDKIVHLPDFSSIMNESLNISGSKLLHLLAETPIKVENIQELSSITSECLKIGYNFNIKNNFGETALDKAKEAENNLLVTVLKSIINYSSRIDLSPIL